MAHAVSYDTALQLSCSLALRDWCWRDANVVGNSAVEYIQHAAH